MILRCGMVGTLDPINYALMCMIEDEDDEGWPKPGLSLCSWTLVSEDNYIVVTCNLKQC